jgi:hypothetical protein
MDKIIIRHPNGVKEEFDPVTRTTKTLFERHNLPILEPLITPKNWSKIKNYLLQISSYGNVKVSKQQIERVTALLRRKV